MLPKIQTREDMMLIIQREIEHHGEPKLLAIRVGVSASCIYAIKNGKTKWPRYTTFASLMDVLPIRLELRSYRDAI